MRHKVFGNQLHRNTNKAKALYRSLVHEVFMHGRIETTLPKAKAVRATIDRVMTFAKKNSVSARREVVKILGGDDGLDRIFNEVAPKFSNRNSGYTRIIKLGQRFSDTAEKVYLELVEGIEVKKDEVKKDEIASSPTAPRNDKVKKTIKKTKKS